MTALGPPLSRTVSRRLPIHPVGRGNVSSTARGFGRPGAVSLGNPAEISGVIHWFVLSQVARDAPKDRHRRGGIL